MGTVFVSEEDGEEITIDHLDGETCVINDSIELELFNEKRFNQMRLRAGCGERYFVISNVYEFTPEGGYIVDIRTHKGEIVYERTVLISKKLRRKR